ncbi:MAG: hypothetical protein PHH93_14145, partial [Prolixibacteraceae bacterium]|nr:hypothetical protein [Prolixibacteraceae bacterium]
MIVKDWRILKFCLKHKVDLLTGSTPEVAHISWLLKKYSVNTAEDDASIAPLFYKVAGPFMQTILAPVECNTGIMTQRTIKYNSYHELSYLHPNHFSPDKKIVEKYFS